MLLTVFQKLFIERAGTDGGAVANYNQFLFCTGYGYVHPAKVIQKTYFLPVVASNQTDIYHVAFFSLKAVNCFDT